MTHNFPTHRQVWGRRQSRPLREKQRYVTETVLPEVLIHIRPDEAIDPGTLFSNSPQRLWLEIGFGGGEHLAAQAEQNPDVGFIGCEPFINGVASLTALIAEKNLKNVRIVMDDARLLLARLPDCCLEAAFILFPDPWPKTRHHKRRIIQTQSIEEISRLLTPSGKLHIATDVPAYLSWILEIMEKSPQFTLDMEERANIYERPLLWPKTRYEQKAILQGRNPGYMVYLRKP